MNLPEESKTPAIIILTLFSLINLALFGSTFFIISGFKLRLISLLFVLVPLAIAFITFLVEKKLKGFEILKVLKDVNIAYLVSFIISLIIFYLSIFG